MICGSMKEKTIESLVNVVSLFPNMRIWQIIMNAVYPQKDIFYMSDVDLMNSLEEFSNTFKSEPEIDETNV